MSRHKLPNRQSTRLPDYDYRGPSAYFVTICTDGRECILGSVEEGTVALSQLGKVVEQCWLRLPTLFPHAELDAFVIMPNHLHGIIILNGDGCRVEALAPRLTSERSSFVASASPVRLPHGTVPGSLAAVIQNFKAVSTRRVNAFRRSKGQATTRLWQQSYYEHVIRNDESLEEIRDYVNTNALNWHRDEYNPRR